MRLWGIFCPFIFPLQFRIGGKPKTGLVLNFGLNIPVHQKMKVIFARFFRDLVTFYAVDVCEFRNLNRV